MYQLLICLSLVESRGWKIIEMNEGRLHQELLLFADYSLGSYSVGARMIYCLLFLSEEEFWVLLVEGKTIMCPTAMQTSVINSIDFTLSCASANILTKT